MEQLTALVDWLAAHPHWIGLAVCLVAFSESLALVGLLVPGAAGMFAFGVLIEAGSIDFWTVWLWAIAGAIAGDGLSFWLGRRYGRQLMGLWPMRRYPDAMDRGIRFFARHGGKSVVIGRFVGPVRPIIPAVAGMMGMARWRFAVANVGSALFWAPAYLLPGMVFSASLAVAAAVATRLATVVVVLLVSGWGVWRGWLMLVPWLRRWQQAAVARLSARAWLAPLAAAVAALGHRRGRFWWLALVTALVTPALAMGSRPLGWEAVIIEAMTRWRTDWGRWLAWAGSQAGAPVAVVAGAVVLVAALVRSGRVRCAALVGASTGVGGALIMALDGWLGSGLSPDPFPSAHTAGVAGLTLAVALIARPAHGSRGAVAVAGALTALVALARVYLGGALPLDALAGAAVGVVIAGVLAFGAARAIVSVRVVGGVVLAVMVGASVAAWSEARRGLDPYPEPVAFPTLPAEAGCERAVEALGRMDKFALWRGSEQGLRALTSAAWQAAPPWTLRGSLQWLNPEPDPSVLPPLPVLLNGRAPALSLIRPTGSDARLVVHAWPVARQTTGEWRWWRLGVMAERLIPAWPITLAENRSAGLPDALLVSGHLCDPGPSVTLSSGP